MFNQRVWLEWTRLSSDTQCILGIDNIHISKFGCSVWKQSVIGLPGRILTNVEPSSVILQWKDLIRQTEPFTFCMANETPSTAWSTFVFNHSTSHDEMIKCGRGSHNGYFISIAFPRLGQSIWWLSYKAQWDVQIIEDLYEKLNHRK